MQFRVFQQPLNGFEINIDLKPAFRRASIVAHMNIVLTGFMATGKSTVGKRLARELNLKFIDIDELIEKEAGAEIKDIFRDKGEEHFRFLESEVIKKLSEGAFGRGLIVSTGGGAVVNPRNREALRAWGIVVALNATADEILKRVGDRDDRPLLARPDKKEAIQELLKKREEAYADCDLAIDTTSKSVEAVAQEIRNFVRSR